MTNGGTAPDTEEPNPQAWYSQMYMGMFMVFVLGMFTAVVLNSKSLGLFGRIGLPVCFVVAAGTIAYAVRQSYLHYLKHYSYGKHIKTITQLHLTEMDKSRMQQHLEVMKDKLATAEKMARVYQHAANCWLRMNDDPRYAILKQYMTEIEENIGQTEDNT